MQQPMRNYTNFQGFYSLWLVHVFKYEWENLLNEKNLQTDIQIMQPNTDC